MPIHVQIIQMPEISIDLIDLTFNDLIEHKYLKSIL